MSLSVFCRTNALCYPFFYCTVFWGSYTSISGLVAFTYHKHARSDTKRAICFLLYLALQYIKLYYMNRNRVYSVNNTQQDLP